MQRPLHSVSELIPCATTQVETSCQGKTIDSSVLDLFPLLEQCLDLVPVLHALASQQKSARVG